MKTKEKIINALEGKKVIEIKVRFKARFEMFLMKWKLLRKFSDYSLKKELKDLFLNRKIEVMIK